MKKLISLFLILCFAFSIFTACDKADSATDGTERTEGTTLASSEPTEEVVLGRPVRDPTETPSPVPPTEPTEPPAPEPVPTLDPDNMPEDFSFALRFGVYGSNSYDSATGRTHKVCQPEDVDKYTTTFIMSDEQLSHIYGMLAQMDLGSYPAEYDPINDPDDETHTSVTPEEITKLTVRAGGIEKVIEAETMYRDEGYDDKAQAFLDVCRYIEKVVTESEEWKALPESTIAFL